MRESFFLCALRTFFCCVIAAPPSLFLMKDNCLAAVVDAAAASRRWKRCSWLPLLTRLAHNTRLNVPFIWKALISSQISCAVTRLALEGGLGTPSLWHHPPCLPATSQQESWRWQTAWMGTCTVEMKAWRMVPLHSTGLDEHVCMFAWRSVNGCDRCGLLCQGWGYTFPPQQRCLQRFVSTQTTDRVKTFYFSAHTCVNRRAHTQPPRSLAFMLTAGSETIWENGEVTIIFERVFSDAYRSKCCAFVAGMSATRGANRDDSCWQKCFKW